jgi:hypothetical protein
MYQQATLDSVVDLQVAGVVVPMMSVTAVLGSEREKFGGAELSRVCQRSKVGC